MEAVADDESAPLFTSLLNRLTEYVNDSELFDDLTDQGGDTLALNYFNFSIRQTVLRTMNMFTLQQMILPGYQTGTQQVVQNFTTWP